MRALCFAIVALICTGCAEVGPLVQSAPPPPDPKTEMPALEARITELIETERLKIDPDAKPLSVDNELVGVARERSADMASKNYLANKSPDGETSASLIMSEDANFQGLLGENIAAQRFAADSALDVNAYAQRFVDTWLASPAHKENLSFKDYSRTGVGAAFGNGTIYVTELFVSDLGLKPMPPQPDVKTPDPKPDSAVPADPGTKKSEKRTVTELEHPKSEDAKPAPASYTPEPRPSLTQ